MRQVEEMRRAREKGMDEHEAAALVAFKGAVRGLAKKAIEGGI